MDRWLIEIVFQFNCFHPFEDFFLSLFLLLLQFCSYVDLLENIILKNKFCYCWDIFVQFCSVTFYDYT